MPISALFTKLHKRLSWQYTGQFRSIFKWSGIEVADSRKYVAWDAKKLINWKQSAKHNDLYVSLFEQEKDAHVDLFCDINYNRKNAAMYATVMDVLTDLLIVGQWQWIRMYLYWWKDGISRIWLRKQEWVSVQDTLSQTINKQKPLYSSHISSFLDHMMQIKKKRIIVIVSDFLTLSDADYHRIQLLMKDHHIVLLRLSVDSYEWLNYIGAPSFGDETLFVDI